MTAAKLILGLIQGGGIPPVVVGIARGVAEAAALAGLIALGVYVGAIDFGDKAYIAPAALGAIRILEGWADHIDPTKKRAPEP